MKTCPICFRQITNNESICEECAKKFSIPTIKPFAWEKWIPIFISCAALTCSLVFSALPYYKNRERHDLVAKVLRPRYQPWDVPELYVELALINRGTQAEIVREIHLHLTDTVDSGDGYIITHVINQRIEKGDKQVVRASLTNFMVFGGKQKWLKVGVVGIPDATDVESVWPVLNCNYATNGQGGTFSEHPNAYQLVQIISNNRLPHQKPSDRWP